MLNAQVLPWFTEQSVLILRVLTDRGTEYCDKIHSHAYQLYLGIDYSRTNAYSPQTDGTIERFHKSMKYEFYDIALVFLANSQVKLSVRYLIKSLYSQQANKIGN